VKPDHLLRSCPLACRFVESETDPETAPLALWTNGEATLAVMVMMVTMRMALAVVKVMGIMIKTKPKSRRCASDDGDNYLKTLTYSDRVVACDQAARGAAVCSVS
jgi:hypothetical protein